MFGAWPDDHLKSLPYNKDCTRFWGIMGEGMCEHS